LAQWVGNRRPSPRCPEYSGARTVLIRGFPRSAALTCPLAPPTAHLSHHAMPRRGFGLLQLLAGVVVIGVLASVAFIKVGSVRERSYVLAMMSDLRGAALLQENHFQKTGAYAHATELKQQGWSLTRNVAIDSVQVYPSYWYYRVRHAKTHIRCSLDYEQGSRHGASARVVCPGYGSMDDHGYTGDRRAYFDFTSEMIEGGVRRFFFSARGTIDPATGWLTVGREQWSCFFRLGDGQVLDGCSVSVDVGPGSCTRIDSQGRCLVDATLVLSDGVRMIHASYAVIGNDPPRIHQIGTSGTYMVGEVITFDGSPSRDADGDLLAYAWDFGDGTAGTGVLTQKMYDAAGTYTVTLVVTDAFGASGTATRQVTIVEALRGTPRARIDVTPEYPVAGEAVTFDGSGSTDPDGDPLTYSWSLSNGYTSGEPVITQVFEASGDIEANLVVRDPDGNWSQATFRLGIRSADQPPAACFTGPANGDTLPRNTDIQFDASCSSSVRGIAMYEWGMGDGTKLYGRSATHRYSAGGTRTVSMRVTDAAGLTATAARTFVVVNSAPVAIASASADTINAGLSVTFTAADSYDPDGDGISFRWTFPGAVQLQGTVATYTFNTQGAYEVRLRVQDTGGASSEAFLLVTVLNTAPVVTLSANPAAVPVGGSVALTASASDADGDPLTYTFVFGNGSSRTQSTPSTTYAWNDDGTYVVNVNVADGRGGWATDSATVTVGTGNRRPVANFTGTCYSLYRRCTFADLSSDADGQVVAWAWDFGDGATSAQRNPPEHTYAAAGTYYVTLTVTDNGGKTATHGFSISFSSADPSSNALPTSLFAYQCQSLICSFTDQSSDADGSIAAWAWSFGGLGGAGGQNPTFTFPGYGTYTVTLQVTDNLGGRSSSSRVVTLSDPDANVLPVAEWAYQCEAYNCTFSDASFDPDGQIVTWRWSIQGGFVYAQNPTHEFTTHGSFSVTLTVWDDRGATHSRTRTVVVTRPTLHPVLTCTTAEGAACDLANLMAGHTYTFSPGYSYSDPGGWLDGWWLQTGDQPSGVRYEGSTFMETVSHTYSQPGTYAITLAVTGARGHVEYASFTAVVGGVGAPTAVLGCYDTAAGGACGDVVVTGTEVHLDGSYSYHPGGAWIEEYQFDVGTGAFSGGASPTRAHVFTTTGTYTVRLRVRVSGSGWGYAERVLTAVPPAPPAQPGISLVRRTETTLRFGYTLPGGSTTPSEIYYEVTTLGDDMFAAPVAASGWIGVDVWTATGLTQNTGYRARVRLRNQGGNSAWSEPLAATTLAAGTAEAPTLVLDRRGRTTAVMPIVFNGNTAHNGTRWQIALPGDPDFLSPIIDSGWVTSLSLRLSYTASGLTPGAGYIARVRVRATTSPATESDWSDVISWQQVPADLSGEIARYSADIPGSVVLDDDVRAMAWYDEHGWAPPLRPSSASTRPSWTGAGLYFDGVDDLLASTNFEDFWGLLPGGAAGGFVMVVMTDLTTGTGMGPVRISGNQAGPYLQIRRLSTGTAAESSVGSGSFGTPGVNLQRNGTRRIFWAWRHSGATTPRLAGGSPGWSDAIYTGTEVPYNSPGTGLRLSTGQLSGGQFIGHIHAVVVWNRIPTSAELNALLAEASLRWGTASGP
jgi:PKD repeat protein/Tfp pilus assembly protein PilE